MKAGRDGYILMETLVALVIVATALFAVMRSFRVSLSAAAGAEHTTVATQLAERKLGEMRAVPPRIVGVHEGDFGADFARYRWRTDVRPLDSDTYYAATVEVIWLEQNVEQRLALSSLVRAQDVDLPWQGSVEQGPDARRNRNRGGGAQRTGG